MLSVLSCNTVCWERFFFTLPFWVTLIGTIYCSVMLWLCATLHHFGILLKDTLPRIETPTLQTMNYSFGFGKRNFNFLTEACLWIWSAQGYSDLFWNHLMCMYLGFLRALTPFFGCQPCPSCPQPAASSQPLLWQSSGTFCGAAKTHSPNKWFWPIRENFECSVQFGWQTERLKKNMTALEQ